MRVLLEGRPGAGKSTVARRLADLLHEEGVPAAGFVTGELRERGRRVGFEVETLTGERGLLAHVDLSGPPRVGRYGVDLDAFERIALPALAEIEDEVVIVDELGKMELASSAFCDAFMHAFENAAHVVATVHVFRHPFTDALKRRAEVLQVTTRTRDQLPRQLADRL